MSRRAGEKMRQAIDAPARGICAPVSGPQRPRAWRGSLRLLRGPFRTLVLGQSFGQFGDGVAQVAFAQLVVFDIGKGATPGRIAAVFAVTLLPFCVVGPLAGVLIDRWDRRRTLVTASAARSVLVLAAIAAAVWRLEPLAYLGVVLLLSSSRFVLDAKGAVLPRLVSGPDLVRANAMSALLGAGAGFAGAVSAAMFVSWSAVLGFLLAGASYLLASACFGRLPAVGGLGRTSMRLGQALRRLAGDLRNGAATIVRQRQLRQPLAAVSAHRLLLGAGFVLLVLIADHRYHLSTTGYGLAIAVTGVATVIGAVSAPWLSARWPPRTLLTLSFLPPAAAIAVCGYAPTLAGLLGALGVTAVSFQTLKVVTDALVGGGSPDAVRGRVFSIYDVLYNLAFVLAGLVMIPLWRPGHERSLLWWLAAAFGLGWLVTARVHGCWPYRSGVSVPVAARWRLRLLALLSGALLVVIFPKPALSWAAWLVLVPWLLLIRRAPARREAAIRAWWSALGFLLAVHYWLLPSLTVFLPLVTGLLATMWLAWGALTWQLLSGELTARKLLGALALVPSGWVMIEAIRSWSALGGPWGMLGASQWRVPAMLASASLGGVWLVSFLVVAVNVAVTVLLDASWVRPRLLAGASALLMLAVGPVWYRAENPARGSATLPVAVIEAGVVHDPRQRLAGEIAATERVRPGTVGLVVWGESSVGFDLFSQPDLQRRLERLAARVRADLLVNVDAAAPDGSIRKTAVLIGPDAILSSYRKMRLVPFGEYIPLRPALGWLSSITKAAALNRERGSHLVVMRDGRTAFAPLVCFESAFPDLSRAASRQGAQLLIFQSATTTFQGSWAQDQQASLAALRAMEAGRPVVNATLAGTSAAFTARGQRLLWWPATSGSATALVPLATRDTPYDRFGDWVLAWCLILLAAFALVSTLTGTSSAAGTCG